MKEKVIKINRPKQVKIFSARSPFNFGILTAYLASYSLSLVNPGIFWDDWSLFNQDLSTILQTFKEAGVSWIAYFHFLMVNNFFGIAGIRAASAGIGLLGWLAFYYILTKTSFLSKKDSQYIAAIFLIIPVNWGRFVEINFVAFACFNLFLLAYYFLIKSAEKKSLSYLLGSLPLFFMSFSINSLVMFYLIPFVHFCWKTKQNLTNQIVTKQKLGLIITFLLPLLFFLYKYFIAKPTGIFKDANHFTIESLIYSLQYVPETFNKSFIELCFPFLKQSLHSYNIFLICCTLGFLFLLNKRCLYSGYIIFLGILCLLLGTIPYLAVRRSVLEMNEWTNRDSLLMGPGFSFILYGTIVGLGNIVFVQKSKVKKILIKYANITLILYLTAVNINNQSAFLMDHFKQEALIYVLKNNSKIKSHNLFLIEDKTRNLNIFQRQYRFYEYNGIFRQIFGDATRFGIALTPEINSFFELEKKWNFYERFKTRKEYNFYEFRGPKRTAYFTINPGQEWKSQKNVTFVLPLKLLAFKWVMPYKYKKFIENGLVLKESLN